MEGGGEEDGGESVGWRYVGPVRRRVYERNPKHGPIDRGEISREPKNGQEALDNSVQVKSASTGRIGIDYNEGEFVVFRRTVTEFHELPEIEIFHGYVVEWAELTQDMRNALMRAGMVNLRGKIV